MAGQTLWQAREVIRTTTRVLNVLTTAAIMAGTVALAMEHGFYAPPLPLAFLRACQFGAALVFLLDVPGRFLLMENRREFFHRRWADLSLLALLTLGLLVQWLGGPETLSGPAGTFDGSVLVVQLYIAGQVVLRGLRLNMILAHSGVHPARLLVISFVTFILLGAVALKLPRAVPPRGEALYWTDALFTSTSAMCVTGLVVRATGSDQTAGLPGGMVNKDLAPAGFSRFGQAVILTLIQLGGLGIMIFGTILAVLLGQHLSLRQGMVMKDMLSSEALGQIGRVVWFVFLATFLVEAIGAVLLFTMFMEFDWPTSTRLFYAVFHSVSAFCNAGFALMPDSLVRYHRYWQVHGVIAPLIVLGGLGFPVLMSLSDWASRRVGRLFGRRQALAPIHLNLHAKLVLWTTAILILGGAAGLMLLESPATAAPPPGRQVESPEPTASVTQMAHEARTWRDPQRLRLQSPGAALRNAVFMSVTARTAGFNTVETDYPSRSLSPGSFFLLVLLMLVGGSPASTAGGMKTVTMAVLVLTVASVVRRRGEVESFHRALPGDIIKRAATVAVCYVGLVFLTTLFLTVTESGQAADFAQLLFGAASGCGTVGLDTGLTTKLTVAGRYVMIVAMFVGRLGPLTMLIAVTMNRRTARYGLPQERVVLG